jgi:hypothetical protein
MNEILINKVHFVWLGSNLNAQRAKNLPRWIEANTDCNFDFLVWYDSELISPNEEEETINYVHSLDPDIMICDIRKYHIMDLALTDDFVKAIEAYNYESGLWLRAKIDPIAREIVNWGFASDVLRMLILFLYKGFYIDVDMKPLRLCDYFLDKHIKSCPIRFCMTSELRPHTVSNYDYDNGEKFIIKSVNNNALYYDDAFDPNFQRMKAYFKIVANQYKWLQDDYYYYILLYFVWGTVVSSGPGALRQVLGTVTRKDQFYPQYDDKSDYTLRLFYEDPLVASTSWNVKRYHVLSILLHDLFQDPDSLFRCYYKVTFGTSYYNLTLIESNWLTKFLNSIATFGDYSYIDEELLKARIHDQVFNDYPDLSMWLSETTIDKLLHNVLDLKFDYQKSVLYPTTEHLFMAIIKNMIIQLFWWGEPTYKYESFIQGIMKHIDKLKYKIKTIDPKFFEELFTIISHIDINMSQNYDMIHALVDSYK